MVSNGKITTQYPVDSVICLINTCSIHYKTIQLLDKFGREKHCKSLISFLRTQQSGSPEGGFLKQFPTQILLKSHFLPFFAQIHSYFHLLIVISSPSEPNPIFLAKQLAFPSAILSPQAPSH